MEEVSKKSAKELMSMLDEMFSDNDAVVTISLKIMDDDSLSTEVILHESLHLPDDSDPLKTMYFTALGSMLGAALDKYPVEQVLGYIKWVVETEVEGKGQQRH